MATQDYQKFFSLIIVLVYLILMYFRDGMYSALALIVPLLVPLILIWFPEPIGDFTGTIGLRNVNQSSHPLAIQLLGWIFLLAPCFFILI